MREIVDANLPVRAKEMPRDEAIELFASMGEHYKVEIIEGIPGRTGVALPPGRVRRPLPRTARAVHRPAAAFKLTSVAGAYWRGDERNEMLQRIYGTAFARPRSSKGTSRCSRRRSGATTAGSEASSTSSASIPRRRRARSSIPRARSSTTS